MIVAACDAILNFFLPDELQVRLVTYEWSESRRLHLQADNFIPGTLCEFVYIRDCTWARPTMRACTELFILARERERERENGREPKRLLSHSRLCLRFFLSSSPPTLPTRLSFSLHVEAGIPVFHDFPSSLGLFFSLPVRACRSALDEEMTNKKITSALTFCNLRVSRCRVEKSTAESCVLLEKSCSMIIPFWSYRECDKSN